MKIKKAVTCEVGKTPGGDLEFGEIYHVVVGKELNEDYFPVFKEFDLGLDFYGLFHDYLEAPKCADRCYLYDTGDWITENFTDAVQIKLWQVIEKIAGEEKWKDDERLNHVLLNGCEEKVLIWVRQRDEYATERNMTPECCRQLADLCRSMKTKPVFVGDRIEGFDSGSCNLWDYYNETWFKPNSIAKQLWFLRRLYDEGAVIASVGMMSGAMDGLPMICGRKAVFLAKNKHAKKRMAKVAKVVRAMKWVKLNYSGSFQKLSPTELGEVKDRIWGKPVS